MDRNQNIEKRILWVAERLFLEKGFSGTSTPPFAAIVNIPSLSKRICSGWVSIGMRVASPFRSSSLTKMLSLSTMNSSAMVS